MSTKPDELTHAVVQDDAVQARRMLNNDPSLLDAVNSGGGAPLHVAAGAQLPELVEWLLLRGADAHLRGPGQRTRA